MEAGTLKKWHFIPRGKPGQRFRDRYHRQHRARQSRPVALIPMLIRLFLALLAFLVGVVLVFIPGPAVVFFFLAGGLLATDWLSVARLLDWSEVHLRKLASRMRRVWNKLSWAARLALLATGGLISLATTYGFYRVMH